MAISTAVDARSSFDVVGTPAPRRPGRCGNVRVDQDRRAERKPVDDSAPEMELTGELAVPALSVSFLELYHESFGTMVRLAVALTGSEASAEDLVHDSFIRMHGHWANIEYPRAYLRRTVVNACRSAARRAK